MPFIDKAKLQGTARHVRDPAYDTTRFLLAADGMGVTVTDIVLAPGVPATYGYDNHVEIAYCIAGDAEVTDAAGVVTAIRPGVMWIAERGERFVFRALRFVFRALVPTRLICVFTPPFEGHETGSLAINRGVTPWR